MGLFSGLGKIAGKLKGIASKVVPGGSLVAGGMAVGGKLLKRVNRNVIKGAAIGAGGLAAGAGLEAMMGGGGGRGSKRYRRINPGNTRAMRRAVRRIEAGAKLYSKFFAIKHGHIKHAPHVRLKGHRRAA